MAEDFITGFNGQLSRTVYSRDFFFFSSLLFSPPSTPASPPRTTARKATYKSSALNGERTEKNGKSRGSGDREFRSLWGRGEGGRISGTRSRTSATRPDSFVFPSVADGSVCSSHIFLPRGATSHPLPPISLTFSFLHLPLVSAPSLLPPPPTFPPQAPSPSLEMSFCVITDVVRRKTFSRSCVTPHTLHALCPSPRKYCEG